MKIINEYVIIDSDNKIKRIDNYTLIDNQNITISELIQTETDNVHQYCIYIELYDDAEQNVVLVNDEVILKGLSEQEILKTTIKQMIEYYNNL